MDQEHRKYIVESLKDVDEVMIAVDKDKTVCESLKTIRIAYPDDELSFFNSGDRQKGNLVTAETITCSELEIKEVVLNLPKVYSSSELLRKLKDTL